MTSLQKLHGLSGGGESDPPKSLSQAACKRSWRTHPTCGTSSSRYRRSPQATPAQANHQVALPNERSKATLRVLAPETTVGPRTNPGPLTEPWTQTLKPLQNPSALQGTRCPNPERSPKGPRTVKGTQKPPELTGGSLGCGGSRRGGRPFGVMLLALSQLGLRQTRSLDPPAQQLSHYRSSRSVLWVQGLRVRA